MEELQELKRRLREERPMDWESLPDLALYMDQVLSYMPRQLIHLGETETLTSAMVNNYIKEGLLPRAEGKKYSRTHLAYLTLICALKEVISVRDVHRLISSGEKLAMSEMGGCADTPEEQLRCVRRSYAYFQQELDQAMKETADRLPDDLPREQLAKTALGLALRSYADQLACQRVLELLGDPEEPKKSKKDR